MEKWKVIEESNNYEISNYGRFRNRHKKLLKLNINANKYYYCNISINGKVSKVKIHRLVSKAFVENPLSKNVVNHINGNKLDNHYTNLEWVTQAENIQHAIRTGLKNPKQNALDQWKKIKNNI